MEDWPGYEPGREQLLQELATTCGEVLASADNGTGYGMTVIAGTITDPRRPELEIRAYQWEGVDDPALADEEHVEGLARGAASMAASTIARCILSGPDTPPAMIAEPADSYAVVERITETPNMSGYPGGHVAEMRIDRLEDGRVAGEVATVISIHSVPGSWEDDQESLYARLFMRDGQVCEADINALSPEDSQHYDACVEMFGEQTPAVQLMEGQFIDESELDELLAVVRLYAVESGVHAASEIDSMLSHIRRIGLQARANLDREDRGITPERLHRLIRFASTIT
jgi:hypothetical protein